MTLEWTPRRVDTAIRLEIGLHVYWSNLIDNKASNSRTVIEINGRDRIGYLFDLSVVLIDLKMSINSAHIATYGERAITVFFVRDSFGHKVINDKKIAQIEKKLMNVLVLEN